MLYLNGVLTTREPYYLGSILGVHMAWGRLAPGSCSGLLFFLALRTPPCWRIICAMALAPEHALGFRV